METSLSLLMTDSDRHKLKDLALSLKKKEEDFTLYKDTLANLIRRSHDINAILSKIHRRTEQEIKDCEKIILEIKEVLGEAVKVSSDDRIAVSAK